MIPSLPVSKARTNSSLSSMEPINIKSWSISIRLRKPKSSMSISSLTIHEVWSAFKVHWLHRQSKMSSSFQRQKYPLWVNSSSPTKLTKFRCTFLVRATPAKTDSRSHSTTNTPIRLSRHFWSSQMWSWLALELEIPWESRQVSVSMDTISMKVRHLSRQPSCGQYPRKNKEGRHLSVKRHWRSKWLITRPRRTKFRREWALCCRKQALWGREQ